MRDHIPFIRSIAAAPDDDAPRLIYSDYLEETGAEENVARAEFIRVQIERARLEPRTPRWNELWNRDTELLDWARKWRQSLPGPIGAYYGGFIRGFVDRIEVVDCGQFMTIAADAFDAMPVRKLIFRPASSQQLFDLVQLRGLQTVCELEVTVQPPAIEGLRALLDLGPWPNLRRIWAGLMQEPPPDYYSPGIYAWIPQEPPPDHRLMLAKIRRRFGERWVE